MRITAILLASAAIVPLSAAEDEGAWGFYVRAQPQVTLMSVDGDAAYEYNGLGSSELKTGDLGLTDSTVAPGFDLMIDPPILFGLAIGGFQYSADATSKLTKSANFGGKTFAANVDVKSELKITDLYGELYFSPPLMRWDEAGLAFGLGAHQIRAKLELSSTGQIGTFDETFIVPVVSARAYLAPVSWLEAEFMIHGMRLVIADQSATYVNAQAQLSLYPIDYVAVFAGYRQVSYNLHVDTGNGQGGDADLTLSGPFAGVAARF